MLSEDFSSAHDVDALRLHAAGDSATLQVVEDTIVVAKSLDVADAYDVLGVGFFAVHNFACLCVEEQGDDTQLVVVLDERIGREVEDVGKALRLACADGRRKAKRTK